MNAAAAHGLPVVPRGSGTGLAGGATPIGDALVIVTAKMTDIIEIRPQDRLAWVEPGLFNLDLGNALRPSGFTYAPDPSSQQASSIGGNVSTNAGGPHCLAYGVTSAHILAVDVVMSDGTVERFGSEAPEAAGYDLRGVVVGSEGTLGVVARVCVRLTPLPPSIRTMLLDFTTVEACAATVSAIIARGVVPAAVEMMDHGIVVAAEAFAHAGYPTDAAAILIVEVDGLDAAVESQSRAVEAAAHEHGVRTIRVAADDAERALLWKGRKSAFGAVAQIAPHYHLHDCVVPRTKLVEVLAGVYAIAERHGPHRHERLPRRRRQPAPPVLVRHARAGHARSACWPPATRSCGCASTREGRSRESTASVWRSATSCRWSSRRTTSTHRRACGRPSIPTGG